MKKSLSILLLATFTAAHCFGAIRAVTPSAWVGKPDSWQMQRHAAKKAAVAGGGAPVVFIGDSITHYWEREGRPVWQKYFESGKRRALNLGYGGDRTENVLWRITEGGELDGYEAKCVHLMIGINNIGGHLYGHEPVVDTVLGVCEILKVIKAKQPKARIILSAILPSRSDPTHEYRVNTDKVNKELAKFADGKSVVWCDFTDKFLDPQGRHSREIFHDGVHLSEIGYEIWASVAVPLIDKVLAAAEDEYIPSVWPSHPSHYVQGESYASIPCSKFPKGHWWATRPLEKRNEIVRNGNIEYDVVMVGDSITHRWEREGGEGRELFAEIRKTYKILNLGYGGDQTQHVIWRMENGELDGYTAKLFMLMIGTNNGGNDIPGIAAGVKRIITNIRERHPESKVLLLPIFPRGAKPTDYNRVVNNKVNAIIKDFADGEKVLWLDFNDKFLTADGTLTKDVMDDLLHPNANGYRIWWENIEPIFKQISHESKNQ